MTAPISGNRPAAQAYSTSSSQGLSSGEAQSLVSSLISKEYDARKTSLGDSRASHMKQEITSEMNKFLAENPKATKEEIEAKFKDVSSKKYGYEFTNKLRDDAFINRLKRKMKEALADRWE